MDGEHHLPWLTCSEDKCLGIRLDAGGTCLAHAGQQDRDVALRRLGDEGTIDARGVTISAWLLERILEAVPRDKQQPDRPCFNQARFDRATFLAEPGLDSGRLVRFDDLVEPKVRFDGAVFRGEASFDRATFKGTARFENATFQGLAKFSDATFERGASFDRAVFDRTTLLGESGRGSVRLRRTDDSLRVEARFDGAIFRGEASFDVVTFKSTAAFENATFQGLANFVDATFERGASFDRARFERGADFLRATFERGAEFTGAKFGMTSKRVAKSHETSFAHIRFENATFGDGTTFKGATFENEAMFGLAKFGNDATFECAKFRKRAFFSSGDTSSGATFGNWAKFDCARFADGASFYGATYGDWASFRGARFGDEASFYGAVFGNEASFHRAKFGHQANFQGAVFGDSAGFDGVTFGYEAGFPGATFGDWARFGPLLGGGGLVLKRAQFGQGSELAISADQLDCRGLKLPAGASLNVRWAEVRLDEVEFGRPSVLAGADQFRIGDWTLNEHPLRRRKLGSWRSEMGSWRTERPRVLSLRGSDVRNLALSNVDLRACRFAGARNLDQLRLEGTIDLAESPAGWWAGRALPPLSRWTRRRTLAEEHRWRDQARYAGWYPRACQGDVAEADEEPSPRPAEIALLYRALRKGREDSKDEPGAADFYYGEMEMRRHDRTAPWPERLVLWLYWLVAGYGLRASRALGCLLGLLVVATVVLATVGFAPAPTATPLTATITGIPPQQRVQVTAQPPEMTADRPFPDRLGTAALVAVEGAVFRTSDQALTYEGRLIQAFLRFVGPVLLALALLSIRGRVKR
jgi:uncharacterized protein YjbI with pentapeptide repeats